MVTSSSDLRLRGQRSKKGSGKVRVIAMTQLYLVLLLSHNLLLLPHAWSDFDQTWSEWPVGEWLQKLCFVWPQRSCKGHRGQKRSFLRKMHLLLHALLDFDETWSEASVGKWLQKLCFVWPQRSCRGHRGQKSNLFFKMLRLSLNFNTMILMTF